MKPKKLSLEKAKSWVRKIKRGDLRVAFDYVYEAIPESTFTPEWKLALTGDANSSIGAAHTGLLRQMLEVNRQLQEATAKVTVKDLLRADRDIEAEYNREDLFEEPAGIAAVGIAAYRKLAKVDQENALRLNQILRIYIREVVVPICFYADRLPLDVPTPAEKSDTAANAR